MNNVTKLNTAQSKANLVVRCLQKFQVWRNRRQAMFQLSNLPDELLKDMGITRGEISDVVRQRGYFATTSTLLHPLTAAPSVAETHIKRAA